MNANDDEPTCTIIYQNRQGARRYEYPSRDLAWNWFETMWGFFRWQAPPERYDEMILLDKDGKLLARHKTDWARLRSFLSRCRAGKAGAP